VGDLAGVLGAAMDRHDRLVLFYPCKPDPWTLQDHATRLHAAGWEKPAAFFSRFSPSEGKTMRLAGISFTADDVPLVGLSSRFMVGSGIPVEQPMLVRFVHE
jgi:hypothetical protein